MNDRCCVAYGAGVVVVLENLDAWGTDNAGSLDYHIPNQLINFGRIGKMVGNPPTAHLVVALREETVVIINVSHVVSVGDEDSGVAISAGVVTSWVAGCDRHYCPVFEINRALGLGSINNQPPGVPNRCDGCG